MRSVVEQLELQVSTQPDKLLYAFLNIDGHVIESVTYAQFFQRTTDIAVHLYQLGLLKPGDRVLLAYPPGIEMIAALFACFRLGLIPVPVYPPARPGFEAALRRINYIADDCEAQTVLTDRSVFWSLKWHQAKHRIKPNSWRKRMEIKMLSRD